MFKFYILVFDPTRIAMKKDIHAAVSGSPHIATWWHYLNSAYLIKSRYTLNTIHGDLTNKVPNHQYLLIEADPYNKNGWLKQAAWDWINKNR